MLGEQSDQEMAALCYDAGADGYVCLPTATTRALLWIVARAIERVRLITENRRLKQTKRRQLQMEHDEVMRLLGQQRRMIESMVVNQQHEFSPSLRSQYHELLRTYIVMGVGTLAEEINRFVDHGQSDNLTPQQIVQLHLQVLEDLLSGLGNRSTRHAMSRADMLVLQVMLNLADR